MIVPLIFSAIASPLQACFKLDLEGFWYWMNIIVDLVFALDMLITFNTAYVYRDTMVTSRLMIAKQYLKTCTCLKRED